jgi:hypothetical protein
VIRIVPRSEGDIMTNVGRCVSGGEKKLRKSRTRDVVRIQSKFIEVILDGAKGNLDKNLFVGSKVEKGRIILATETGDREKSTVKRDRRKVRLHIEDRFRGRTISQRGGGRNRRHRSAQRKREKGGITCY